MRDDSPLSTLAVSFALLSLAAVGGANAVAPDMHRLAVDVHGWMSDRVFVDLFAIANAAPGPNVLVVSLIGYHVAGVPGALTATLAMCLPSCLLAVGVTSALGRMRDAPWRRLGARALAPVTIGLVLAAAWVLLRAADPGWSGLLIGAATMAGVLGTRLNPLWFLAGAGAAGLALG